MGTRLRMAAIGLGAILLTSVSLTVLQGAAANGAPTSHFLSIGTGQLGFETTTLGTYSGPAIFSLQNTGAPDETIDLTSGDLSFSGPGPDHYIVVPLRNVRETGSTSLGNNEGCFLDVYFFPGEIGDRSATMTIQGLQYERRFSPPPGHRLNWLLPGGCRWRRGLPRRRGVLR